MSKFQIHLQRIKLIKNFLLWGTYRSLINNAIRGVSEGHEKILELWSWI